MKYFLLLLSLSFSVMAQPDIVEVHKVRSIDYDDNEATVTFWDTNQVFRIPANSKFIPCLDNGWKAEQEVVLGLKKDAKVIVDCKLYGGGIPTL